MTIHRIAGVVLLCSGAFGQDAPKPPEPPAPPVSGTGEVRRVTFGDAAPAIKVEKWVRGEPVEGFEAGKVYVVWFWSTWSGPAAKAFPLMREIGEKHAGVKLVGVALWEGAKPVEAGSTYPARVEAFAAGEQGKMLPGALAYDGDFGEMAQTWLRGGDIKALPAAFVVDQKGKIAWMGHPLDPTEKLVDIVGAVVAGTHDVKAAAARAAAQAADRLKGRELDRQFRKAAEAEDVKRTMEIAEQLLALRQDEFAVYVTEAFRFALVEKHEEALAYTWALRLLEGPAKDHANVLNSLAWTIVDAEGVEMRDLAIAMMLAKRADEVSGGTNAALVDTLARVYFEKGDVDKAIELQEKALGLETGDKASFVRTLERYKAAKGDRK